MIYPRWELKDGRGGPKIEKSKLKLLMKPRIFMGFTSQRKVCRMRKLEKLFFHVLYSSGPKSKVFFCITLVFV